MKGKFLFAALASVVLASCTNDEQMVEVPKGNEIRFAVAAQTASSRAEHDKDYAYAKKLKVWAWEKGDTTTIINGDEYDAANNTFKDNRIYYYPQDGTDVDFLLVPMDAIEGGYFTAPTRNDDGTTDFQFEVGHVVHDSIEHSTDLMTSEIVTQGEGVVGVILRHLTAKLNIKVQQIQKQDDVKTSIVELKYLKIGNIRNHGHVGLDEEWSAVNVGDDCFWTEIDSINKCDWNIYSQPDNENGYFLASHVVDETNTPYISTASHFVVPQKLGYVEYPQSLYLHYAIHTKYKSGNQPSEIQIFEKEIPLNILKEDVPYWAMNKNITYIISMDPMQTSHKITFDVDVEAWGNLNGEETVKPSDSTSQQP